MITLYGMSSPNVLKILIALEELTLAYRFTPVDVFQGEQFTPAFAALTPNRKVPVIVDDAGPDGTAFTLWESGAILIYLAEKTGRLLSSTAPERLIVLQWLMFQMAGIGPIFGQHAHFRIFAPESEHNYARARYATEVKRLYDVVEKRLTESAFLGASSYSIADIAAWPWLQGAQGRGVDLARLPATQRWIEAIRARPAIARAKAVLDTLKPTDIPKLLREKSDALDRYLGRGRYLRPD